MHILVYTYSSLSCMSLVIYIIHFVNMDGHMDSSLKATALGMIILTSYSERGSKSDIKLIMIILTVFMPDADQLLLLDVAQYCRSPRSDTALMTLKAAVEVNKVVKRVKATIVRPFMITLSVQSLPINK